MKRFNLIQKAKVIHYFIKDINTFGILINNSNSKFC